MKTNNKMLQTRNPATRFMPAHLKLKLALAALLIAPMISSAGTWTPLNNQPTFLNPPSQCALYPNANCAPQGSFSTGSVTQGPVLLTDGRLLFANLMVDDNNVITEVINILTPDKFGSYVNGTWSKAANLPAGYNPVTFGAAVLADGRVVFIGGEHDYVNCTLPFCGSPTSQGAVYDPVANSWTAIPPPSFFPDWTTAGPAYCGLLGLCDIVIPHIIWDTQTVVLPNGKLMVASKRSAVTALLDPKTLTWSQTGNGKADPNSEEGWTLLPNGKVLTIDTYTQYLDGSQPLANYPLYPANTNSEIYDPKSGSWTSAGSTIVPLSQFDRSCITHFTFTCFIEDFEMGPAVLMPNGIVLNSGGYGNTALYNSHSGMWAVGPKIPTVTINGQPVQLVAGDNGAALLPNGNVLVNVSAAVQSPPAYFFEFDGSKYISEPATPDAPIISFANMIVLPTGQILQTDFNTDVEIYTPDNQKYNPAWAPIVTSAPKEVQPGGSYKITGIRFNGMSQAGDCGDDYQAATNYPLVRITNLSTGHVFYSRTHDHSSMGVAVKGPVFTYFDVPNNQELGQSKLEVVANGIPSKPKYIEVKAKCDGEHH